MKKIILSLIFYILFMQNVYGKNTLNILLDEDDYNPYSEDAPYQVRSTFETAVFGQLLEIKNNSIYPSLLKEAYYDFKQNEYVLVLKDNTLFHNGRKATAQDLEFSLLRMYLSSEKSYMREFLSNVTGIDKIKKRGLKKYRKGLIPGLKVIQPHILKIKLDSPEPNFLYYLTDTACKLVPMEELNENFNDWKKYPIGAGPYAVIAPGYQNRSIHLKKVDKNIETPDYINMYMKVEKEINYDVSIFDIDDPRIKKFKYIETKNPAAQYTLIFTNTNELSNNINFRKFVQAALDPLELEKLPGGYQVSYEFYPYTSWGLNDLKPPYDPELAKKYYDLIPSDLKKIVWEVPVYATGNVIIEPQRSYLNLIKQQLEKFNFKVNFYPYYGQFLTYEIAQKAPFDISAYRVEPFGFLSKFSRLLQSSDDEYMRPLYDEKLESLYQQAYLVKAREEKLNIINEISKHVHEQAYWVPLLNAKSKYYYNSETVESLTKSGDEMYLYNVSNTLMKK